MRSDCVSAFSSIDSEEFFEDPLWSWEDDPSKGTLFLLLTGRKETLITVSDSNPSHKIDKHIQTWHFDICCDKKGELWASVSVLCVCICSVFCSLLRNMHSDQDFYVSMVILDFCANFNFLFCCASGASTEARGSGSLQQTQEVNLARRTTKRTKGPEGKAARSSWAILLSQSRFLNEMDLILEWQADVFCSHPPASVSQLPSDANSPPPCKTQRVRGETSSFSKWIITGYIMASYMAFLSKVHRYGWILAPCLPLRQVNEQLYIKNNPFIIVENDIRKVSVDQ